MEKKIIGNKSTPLSHLDHPVKQLLTTISKNLTLISLLSQQEIPSSLKYSVSLTWHSHCQTNLYLKKQKKQYCDLVTDHNMVILTDGSVQGNQRPVNPGTVGSGIVTKKQSLQSSQIKLAKAVTPMAPAMKMNLKPSY